VRGLLVVLLLGACNPPLPPPIHIDRDPACNPVAIGNDCFLPFPSSTYTRADDASPTGVRLAYDTVTFDSPDGDLPIDLALFDFADGVSPIGQMLVNFGVDVDPDQLWDYRDAGHSFDDGVPIAVLNEQTGERAPIMAEMDQTGRDGDHTGRWALILRPMAPLDFGARYEVVITDDLLDADGNPLPRSAAFDALRDGTPTDDQGVESLRAHYDDLFTTAENAGFARDNLLLAWDFQVASERSILGPIRSMRDQALAAIGADGVPYTITQVIADPNPNVAWIVRGTFAPPGFLADNEIVRDDQDGVVRQQDLAYPFTMLIPPQAKTGGNLPLVLFGHGIFGSGDSYLTGSGATEFLQPLSAQQGAVVLATDWIGLSSGDLNLILQEVVPDLSRVRIVTDRLAQAIVNNLSLVELAVGDLEHDEQIGRTDDTDLIDPSKIYYYGISLGGVEGTSLVSMSPRITRALLAVPGGGWSDMMQRSTDFSQIQAVIDLRYPDPLTQVVFIAALQQFFDVPDPGNIGRLMQGDSDLPDAPARKVLVQEAIGDCQVPNLATELLMRTIGAHHLAYAPDPIYGLDTVDSPADTSPVLTQYVLPDQLAAYTPPNSNTIPSEDNGVHAGAPTEDSAFQQAIDLFQSGDLVHTCDGPCDPD
jgi:hypothetical protein